jgi:hypothetical protein
VGIAPVGGVQAADVVAAQEGDLVVDHQQLAVIPAGVPGKPETGGDQRMPADGDVGRKAVERARDDQVGELVEHDVDLDPAVGRVDQRILERLTDFVPLPDEGLEEHSGPGLADGVEHVLVQVLPVAVDGDLRAPDRHRSRGDQGKGHRPTEPLAAIVDHGERKEGDTLHRDECLHEMPDHLSYPDPSPRHVSKLRGSAPASGNFTTAASQTEGVRTGV